MVLMPEFQDQIIPLTKLGKSLGVDYKKYDEMFDTMREAESYSTPNYQVSVKWSKITDHGMKSYTACYGPPFILQLSGSGLVAPCGMLFNERYKNFHIGNIRETRFKDIFHSDRYWEVINYISSEKFNARVDCGTNCLQHKTNEILDRLKRSGVEHISRQEQNYSVETMKHINFI